MRNVNASADLVPATSELSLRRPMAEAGDDFIIVINSDAGAVRERGPRTLRALVKRSLGGALAKVITTDRHDLGDLLVEVSAQRPRAVAVIGGDGTAHTALQTLTPLGVPVAPLPGGTMNRLSARVFGRANLEQCVAAIADSDVRPLAGGRVGAHCFYVAAGFGAWMQVQSLRERLRKPRSLTGLLALLRMSPRQFADRVTWAPEEGGSLTHSTLFVGVGRIDTALGFGAERHEPALFEAAGADIRNWADVAVTATAALMRRWRRLERVTSLSTRSLQIESAHDGLPALFDGEFHMLPHNNQVLYDPACGLVWAPKRRRTPW